MENPAEIAFEHSLEWIRNHPLATNHDVPEELRQMWSMDEDEDPLHPSEFHLSVFMFGYIQQLLLTDGKPPKEKRVVNMQELLANFKSWHLKLALCELHRQSAVRSNPLPLFAFPAGEELEYWPNPDFAKSATD